MQIAFESQFFAHVFKDGELDPSVQTDGLSVVKKHEDYMVIKNGINSNIQKLMKVQVYLWVAACLFLLAGIWNIISLKGEPFWLSLLHLESNLFKSEWGSNKENYILFNILVMLTTLCNCLIYFIVGVVCMQSVSGKSMTSATYFRSASKVGIAAVASCSGLTFIFGAILIGESMKGGLLILFIV